MLIQLGQVSLYRCQSNQWFINRRANDENSDGGGKCDEEEATPSNSIAGAKGGRETGGTVSVVSRGGSRRIDRRTQREGWTGEVRGGWRASQSIRGLFGRWTLTRGPAVHMHRTHIAWEEEKRKKWKEGRRSERSRLVVEAAKVEMEKEQVGTTIGEGWWGGGAEERVSENEWYIEREERERKEKEGETASTLSGGCCIVSVSPCCSSNRDRGSWKKGRKKGGQSERSGIGYWKSVFL